MFLGLAQLERVENRPGYWRLTQALTYKTREGFKITVPKGFITDLASIPRPLRFFFRVNGRHIEAAILHDYLYYKKGFVPFMQLSRSECDDTFYFAMLDSDVPEWKAAIMWLGVRVGGFLFFYSK